MDRKKNRKTIRNAKMLNGLNWSTREFSNISFFFVQNVNALNGNDEEQENKGNIINFSLSVTFFCVCCCCGNWEKKSLLPISIVIRVSFPGGYEIKLCILYVFAVVCIELMPHCCSVLLSILLAVPLRVSIEATSMVWSLDNAHTQTRAHQMNEKYYDNFFCVFVCDGTKSFFIAFSFSSMDFIFDFL